MAEAGPCDSAASQAASGVASAMSALALGLWVIGVTVYKWNLPDKLKKTPRGCASVACLILLMSAIQLLSLGIIGEYLARIFQEVKGRPTFLIARVTGRAAAGAGITPAAEPADLIGSGRAGAA